MAAPDTALPAAAPGGAGAVAASAPRRYTLQPTAGRRLGLDFDAQLNDEQREVVMAGDGPLLVLAGAGSGKTRTLTYRVARLIERGVPPEGILLLTFTNKAAREMLARVGQLVQGDLRRLLGGTFHHVAHLTLRRHAAALGFGENFGILDREDAVDLMDACIAELGLGAGVRRFPRAAVVADLYSTAVNMQKPLLELVAERRPQFMAVEEGLLAVARRYHERKQQMNVMDFDDLLLQWKRLFVERPEVAQLLRARFEHVLVDEYQDTNRLQGDLVDLCAAGHRNVAVVGDDAQSIYAFRGACFDNILKFPERWPGARTFRLTRNYRSTPQILGLANASIARNARQFPKELRAERPEGPPPALVPLRDVFQQAAFVAQRVLELRDEGVPLQELAVLYRAHHHSMELQIELGRRGIPFIVRSGVRFFEQAHIKDVLAYLKFVENPRDELAFKRLVRLYPGIGSSSADALWKEVSLRGDPRAAFAGATSFDAVLAAVPARARASVRRVREAVAALADPGLRAKPGTMVNRVLDDTGYMDYLRARFSNADARADDVRQLGDYAAQYASAADFVAEISLLSELAAEEVVEGADADEQLTLSSVHQAKGLEWKCVFVIWLADGRFPSAPALRDFEGEEEERRLFYVAATRAKDELYLCYPILTAEHADARVLMRPSRFVAEVGEGPGAPPFEKWQIEEGEGPALTGGAGPDPPLPRGEPG